MVYIKAIIKKLENVRSRISKKGKEEKNYEKKKKRKKSSSRRSGMSTNKFVHKPKSSQFKSMSLRSNKYDTTFLLIK